MWRKSALSASIKGPAEIQVLVRVLYLFFGCAELVDEIKRGGDLWVAIVDTALASNARQHR